MYIYIDEKNKFLVYETSYSQKPINWNNEGLTRAEFSSFLHPAYNFLKRYKSPNSLQNGIIGLINCAEELYIKGNANVHSKLNKNSLKWDMLMQIKEMALKSDLVEEERIAGYPGFYTHPVGSEYGLYDEYTYYGNAMDLLLSAFISIVKDMHRKKPSHYKLLYGNKPYNYVVYDKN